MMRLVPLWGLQLSFVAAHLVLLRRHPVATPSRAQVVGRSLSLGREGGIFGYNRELGDGHDVRRRHQRESRSSDALGWFHHQVRDGNLSIQTGHFPRYLAQLKGGGDRSNFFQDIYLEVSRLHCGSCVKRLEHALFSKQGVIEASVNLATGKARVTVEGSHGLPGTVSSVTGADLVEAAEAAGFPSRVLSQRLGETTDVVLDVQKLKCGGCVSRAEEALAGVRGVRKSAVNLVTGTATVTLGGSPASAVLKGTQDALVRALHSRGYPSRVLRIGSAAEEVEASDERVTPAERYEREAAESRKRVRTSLFLLTASALLHLGHHTHAHAVFSWLGPMVSPTLRSSFRAGWLDWLQAGLATTALMGPGSSLIRSGMGSIRRLAPDMDSLVSTGMLAVYLSSVAALVKPSLGFAAAFHEPVMLLGAVLLGRSLEARQRMKAARGLQAMFDAQPDQARLVDGEGHVTQVPADRVHVGDVVEVLPGDRFSVDGVIIAGFTAADESSITGEATPVPKGPGDVVLAGTCSAADGGAVTVKTTANGAKSVMASVIALVEDAQVNKPPVQRMVDAVAGKFTWLVFAASASAFVFWSVIAPFIFSSWTAAATPAARGFSMNPKLVEALAGNGGGAWALGARLAVDVCLVACPCSLGLATPTAIMVGTGVAAERGLVLRGADVLESARKVSTVVFDKTGTITTGKPTITAVLCLDRDWDESQVLGVAAAVEKGCGHPLAEAIVHKAEKSSSASSGWSAEDLRTVPGMGASAKVSPEGASGNRIEVHVGSPGFIRDACPRDPMFDPVLEQLFRPQATRTVDYGEQRDGVSREISLRLSSGETPILVVVGRDVVGVLFAADTVRPGVATVVEDLKRRGLSVRIASGDRMEPVCKAAEEVGISREALDWSASPADKASLVRSLRADGEVVMMVGDGVNDAPGLAAADVGVALRGGTGSALDAADVILMRDDDVRAVGQCITISRLTMNKVRENLIWALGYNVIALPLAAGAFLPWMGLMLSPAIAGGIMSCSSVAVVTNSLLLRETLERELGPPS